MNSLDSSHYVAPTLRQALLHRQDVVDGSWRSSPWLLKVLNHPANTHTANVSSASARFNEAATRHAPQWKLLVQYHCMVGAVHDVCPCLLYMPHQARRVTVAQPRCC